MKVKDLMIGDWVLGKKKPVKVETINDNDKCINEVYCQGDIVDELSEEDIEPIHITPEILKANGFGVCYESCLQTKYQFWSYDGNLCVEYKLSKQTKDYNYLKIFINDINRIGIRILYVHELQHALRLCGLNDLADNFKVV